MLNLVHLILRYFRGKGEKAKCQIHPFMTFFQCNVSQPVLRVEPQEVMQDFCKHFVCAASR